MTTTIIFRNGIQLQLETGSGDDLARKFAGYLKSPKPEHRAVSINYSNGAEINRTFTVDLEALAAVLHK